MGNDKFNWPDVNNIISIKIKIIYYIFMEKNVKAGRKMGHYNRNISNYFLREAEWNILINFVYKIVNNKNA